MSNISQYDTSASNNDSSPPNGAPEGMAPSTVNDVMRDMMSRMAKWWEDSQGSLVSGGTGDDYTLTTNSSYQALADLPALTFRADRANTGAATLQIDSLGSRDIQLEGGRDLLAGEIRDNQIVLVVYDPNDDVFQMLSTPSVRAGEIKIWEGSVASIPSGWQLCDGTNGTPDLRNRFIVGAGDSYNPDDTGGSQTHDHGGSTNNHALNESQLPNVSGSFQIRRIDTGLEPIENTSGTFSNGSTAGSGSSIQVSGTQRDRRQINFSFGSGNPHDHGIGSSNHRPPYYALAFIQRL